MLVLMNTISQATTAFTFLLAYPTVDGPRFKVAFGYTLVCLLLHMSFTQVVRYFANRDELRFQQKLDAKGVLEEEKVDSDLKGSVEGVVA